MTQDVADKQAVNLKHVLQANNLLQRTLKGSVSEEQMQAIALAVGSGQNPTTIALARMIRVAYARDPVAIKEFLAKQLALYTEAQTFVNRLIDGNVDPFVPPGLNKVTHRMCGEFEWDKDRFADPKLLYLDLRQQNGGTARGYELRDALEGKSILNANVLDWLLKHPAEIPESWKGKAIFFWGTIYSSDAGDGLYVRFLYWDGGRWYSGYYWLGSDWDDSYPALLASPLP